MWMKTVIMYKEKEADWKPCLAGGAQRGAALIIALSVLLVLLSIAITFALMVRYESEMSQQTFEAARAENLLDGVLAKAMYRLNRDLEDHPDVLSLDHSWRTWFSGAAFVGKTWTREKQGVKNNVGLYFHEQGLVSINIDFIGKSIRLHPICAFHQGQPYRAAVSRPPHRKMDVCAKRTGRRRPALC